VLVDVPCSGLGALRRKPEIRWRLTEEELQRLPAQQEGIARAAMALCAPRGRLIYATCTVLADENERVVERLLAHSQFSLVPIKEIAGTALAEQIADPSGCYLKLFPHRHRTDGFFAAVLRRAR
jgi:16S rRNA (cytosine967-C5)-methyltransferase